MEENKKENFFDENIGEISNGINYIESHQNEVINPFSTKNHKDKSSKAHPDKDFITLLAKNMKETEDDSKKKLNCGSLYNLFDSFLFDIHFLICYLDKNDNQGITDTLVNIMYKKFINESFFYLPQLCTMITFKKYYQSLENFLLDRCVNQMKFSLKVSWLVLSYIDDNDVRSYDKYETMVQRIETTLVNGRRATMTNYKQFVQNSRCKSHDEIFNVSVNKQVRLDYFSRSADFYQKLKDMGEKLREFPKEPKEIRRNTLRSFMMSYNVMINVLREELKNNKQIGNTVTKNFYKGIILPFDDSKSTLDEYNTLIVRIIPVLCDCFSTKARVPVKITVETVKVIECEDWEHLFIEQDDIFLSATEYEHLIANNEANYNEDLKVEKELKVKKYASLSEFYDKIKKIENEKDLRKSRIDKKILDELNEMKNINEFCITDLDKEINPFGKKFSEIAEQIKHKSPFRKFQTYCLKSFMSKANDDLRQELMAMQLIKRFEEVFQEAGIPLNLRPYEILITSSSSGLIEYLPNTISLDGLKKKLPPEANLSTFFRNFFKESFEEAQRNFVESLAAYSLVCYLMQIKDRHNGNILIDMNGRIIHIDFGFILGISPGNLNFENAPFKFTSEYMEIMDGEDSPYFHYFKSLFLRGLIELRRHVDIFVKIVEIMSKCSKLPCFPPGSDASKIVSSFRERFNANKSEEQYLKIVNDLVDSSVNNWRTSQYDYFQKITNGIIP